MADINGAGSGSLGGLDASANGHIEWWHVALESPSDMAVEGTTALVLNWIADTWDNSVVDVQVQVSDDPGFVTTVLDTVVTDCAGDGATISSTTVSGLTDNTTYYWRARVTNIVFESVIDNPSYESDVFGWLSSGTVDLTHQISDSVKGSACAEAEFNTDPGGATTVLTGSTPRADIDRTKEFTFSTWVKRVNTDGCDIVRLLVVQYRSDNSFIVSATAVPTVSLPVGEWVYLSGEVTSWHADTAKISARIYTGVGGYSADVGGINRIDGWSAYESGSGGYTGPWTDTRSFDVFVRRSDAVDYIYENIGFEPVFEDSSYEYVLENVGFEPILEDSSYEYVLQNVGVEHILDDKAFEYAFYGDVNTDTPNPYIWFLRPNFGRSGDGIAIYGLGFGDLQSTFNGVVEIDWGGVTGWQSVSVVSWQTFPPTADAYTEDRELNEVLGKSDPQHTVIEIIVPPGAIPPGYPVRVRTDGP